MEQPLGPLGDALQDGLQLERGGDIIADFGQCGHLFRAADRFRVQARGVDRGTGVGGDRRQQAQRIFVEILFLRRALHAEDTNGARPD